MNSEDFLRASLERGEACLAAADLEALVAGQGSPQAAEHLPRCAYCRGEVEVLRSFLEGVPTAEESSSVRRIEQNLRTSAAWKGDRRSTGPWAFLGRPRVGMAAAGLAAALAVGVFLNQPRPSAPEADTVDVVRSMDIVGIAPTGDLAEPPSAVRWSAVPGAVRYRVSLEEVDGTSIWRQTASSAELVLPAEARELMTDRKTLRWAVSAEDGESKTLATSTSLPFRFVRGSK